MECHILFFLPKFYMLLERSRISLRFRILLFQGITIPPFLRAGFQAKHLVWTCYIRTGDIRISKSKTRPSPPTLGYDVDATFLKREQRVTLVDPLERLCLMRMVYYDLWIFLNLHGNICISITDVLVLLKFTKLIETNRACVYVNSQGIVLA